VADETAATVGDVLEELMTAKGLTAYRVSQLIGAHTNSVRKALNKGGAGLSLEMFRGICAALGVTPAKVLGRLPAFELLDVPVKLKGRPRTMMSGDTEDGGDE